jgi:hypothetical protein
MAMRLGSVADAEKENAAANRLQKKGRENLAGPRAKLLESGWDSAGACQDMLSDSDLIVAKTRVDHIGHMTDSG